MVYSVTAVADALLDTTFFIDYHRGDEGARSLWLEIAGRELSASVSPITVFELWVGSIGRTEELTYRAMLMPLDEAPLTASAAEAAAVWLRDIRSDASEVLVRDAFIAATAMLRKEAIYTRNVSDFRRFYANIRAY